MPRFIGPNNSAAIASNSLDVTSDADLARAAPVRVLPCLKCDSFAIEVVGEGVHERGSVLGSGGRRLPARLCRGLGRCSRAPTELVVYSSRNEQLIKPMFDRYTAETGQAIKFVTDDAGPLIERLAAEGANSPADLLITVDAGDLWHAAERGLLQPVDSPILRQNIPAHLRDPENRWFGLSVRARTIVYSTERVKPEELSDYEALADPQWRGRLCLRTSKSVYNQSLVAMLIAQHGEGEQRRSCAVGSRNLAAHRSRTIRG